MLRVVTSCTRNSTEIILLRPRNVSVKIPVKEVATATATLQSRFTVNPQAYDVFTHGIRNVQTEPKSAVNVQSLSRDLRMRKWNFLQIVLVTFGGGWPRLIMHAT